MRFTVPFSRYVEEAEALYFASSGQWLPPQGREGTKRSVQIVSIIALKDWGGVPREMGVV